MMKIRNLLPADIIEKLKILEEVHPFRKRFLSVCVENFGDDVNQVIQQINFYYEMYLVSVGKGESSEWECEDGKSMRRDMGQQIFKNSDKKCWFRGLPIQWKSVERIRITPNVFGDPPLEEVDGYKHLICYDGKEYEPDDFFAAVFGGEYKKYPYRVKFKGQVAKDIMKISVNQRTKLQYNILAYHFKLVSVSEQDEQELKTFFDRGENLTAQRIAQKMKLDDGVRKIVTFGCGLKVDGAYPGTWCYCVEQENGRTIYKGKTLTWKEWAIATKDELARLRRYLESFYYNWKMRFYMEQYPEKVNAWKAMLYYSSLYHQYTTLPLQIKEKLEIWMLQFMRDGDAEFPFPDGVVSEEYSFSVDYNTDVEIEKNWALKKEMAAYNREQNAERNKEHGKNRVAKRATQTLPDGDFTRDDLKALGYGEKAISNLLRDKRIIWTHRRTPERKYIYQKNFV